MGFDCRNTFDWFLESLPTAVFNMPGICDAVILMRLLHLNSTLMPDSNGPHTRQLNSIGTSSFATISIHDHSVDQAKCIHCDPKTAPQLHDPETFVKFLWYSKEQSNVLSSFLSLAKRCHHQG